MTHKITIRVTDKLKQQLVNHLNKFVMMTNNSGVGNATMEEKVYFDSSNVIVYNFNENIKIDEKHANKEGRAEKDGERNDIQQVSEPKREEK